MKVEALMNREAKGCGLHDSLNRAAELMWDNDCGCVPVCDAEGVVVGMITDRDICMAAYTQGAPLIALAVSKAMARGVQSCRPHDTIGEAEAIMRAHRIRRLPVVDAEGRLVGILSLNDIAREAERERRQRAKEVTADEVATTLAAVCQLRGSRDVAAAA